MDINNLEEQIKKVFGQHNPEMDTDTIWENIEPRLKKKKKRRFIIWFWAVFGLAALCLFIRKTPLQHPDNMDVAAAPFEKNTEREIVQPSREVCNAGSIIAENAPLAAVTEKGMEDFSPSKALTVEGSMSFNQELSPETILIKEKSDNSEQNSFKENAAFLLPATWHWQVASLDTVPKPFVLVKPEKEKTEKSFSTVFPDDDEKKKGKKKRRDKHAWQHDISVHTGPALAIRHMGKGQATTAHVEGRRKTERTLESFTFGFLYATSTHKGLVFKTGLDYRQINEKFHFAYTEKETEQIIGIVTLTVDGSGNNIGQTNGLKTITKTTNYSNTAYNHYRFINLPIGIGYRNGSRKSGWELSGGVDFNLFFRAKAVLYNADNIPTTYKYGSFDYNQLFRKNTGMGLWGTWAYDWNMTDRLRWQFLGTLQIPFKSVTQADFSVVQRYFNAGAQIGIVYRLNPVSRRSIHPR